MKATSYTEFSKNPGKYLDSTIDDAEPIIITRPGNRNVVIISQAEHDNLKENLHLVATSANRQHLDQSIEQAKVSKLKTQGLLD